MLTTIQRLLAAILLTAQVSAVTPPESGAEVMASIAPSGMVMAEETLYVADSYHRSIWTVNGQETVLLTGRTEPKDGSGRPLGGYNDGKLQDAAFSEPWDMVAYRDGFLVSDRGNHVIRYIDLKAGTVETALGTGNPGCWNDWGVLAAFDSPSGLAVGGGGEVFIADTGNHRIRRMSPNGEVTTYAGGEEGCALGNLRQVRFSEPTGLCYVNGVLYVADSGNHRIVALFGDKATLTAGGTLTGDAAVEGSYLDGPAEEALFSSPQGIAEAKGILYVSDTGNGAIRAIEKGQVRTVLSMGDKSTYPVAPRGILMEKDTLYVGDVFSRVLLKLDQKTVMAAAGE